MKRIVYVSTARPDLSDDDVKALVAQAVQHNRDANVTGLLAFNGVNFLQALEGDDEAVALIYEAIKRDSRHSGVISIVDEPCDDRLFPDWRMRYVRTAARPLLNAQPALDDADVEGCAHVGRLFRNLARIG
jgi:hypothetical protein